jgi:hypothetical protein
LSRLDIFVSACNVTNRAMKPYLVVMPDVAFDEANGILYYKQCARTDALRCDRTMPLLDLAIALGIVRYGSHMGDTADADEFLEVPGYELESVQVSRSRGRKMAGLSCRAAQSRISRGASVASVALPDMS